MFEIFSLSKFVHFIAHQIKSVSSVAQEGYKVI